MFDAVLYVCDALLESLGPTPGASLDRRFVDTGEPTSLEARRPRNLLRAHDVKTGKVWWEARLGTSAQGYPVSFEIDGRQYIGVMSGLGGGSPRNVPAAILPDITIPQNGQALYVFALPERK